MHYRLLLITDVDCARRAGRAVVATIAKATADVSIAPGVAVLVRDVRDVRAEDDIAAVASAVRAVASSAGVATLVHGHPRLVGPLKLDGCHLPSRMAHQARLARLQMPPGSTLGLSMHPRFPGDVIDRHVDAADAADAAVDYATWSPIFSPTSKRGDTRATLGLTALRGHQLPVVALGGVNADNAAACIAAGASGVAVIGAVMGAHDPGLSLRTLCAALNIEVKNRLRRRPVARAA